MVFMVVKISNISCLLYILPGKWISTFIFVFISSLDNSIVGCSAILHTLLSSHVTEQNGADMFLTFSIFNLRLGHNSNDSRLAFLSKVLKTVVSWYDILIHPNEDQFYTRIKKLHLNTQQQSQKITNLRKKLSLTVTHLSRPSRPITAVTC